MSYRQQRNYENLNKAIYPGDGRFDIPFIEPVECSVDNWISFNFAKTCEDPEIHGVHFFIDDYQFNRVWAQPDAYLDRLRRFQAVCSPDFSTYTDFPPGGADLQPLPQALARCLLAGPRHHRHSDDQLERLFQL